MLPMKPGMDLGRVRLNPHDIKPPHPVREPAQLAELAADMRENGWRGRPLLVVRTAAGYHAWTGSHRIAAALEASLPEVPCYVIPESSIAEHERPICDSEKLNILRKVGDETAIRLMWLEGRQ